MVINMNNKYLDFSKLLELVDKKRKEQGLPPLQYNEYGRYNSLYKNSSSNTLRLTCATTSMLSSIL